MTEHYDNCSAPMGDAETAPETGDYAPWPESLEEQSSGTLLEGTGETDFLTMLSRSMRDGLGAIVGYSDLVLENRDSQLDEQDQGDLERIRQAAQQVLAHLGGLERVISRERRKREIADGLRRIAQLGRRYTDLGEMARRSLEIVADMFEVGAVELWLDRGERLDIFARYWADKGTSTLVESAEDSPRLDASFHKLKNTAVVVGERSIDPGRTPTERWVAIPVVDAKHDGYIGLIRCRGDVADDFDAADQQVFNTVGRHVGAVIGQMRRFGLVHRQATSDELTGVANRRYFFEQASNQFQVAERTGRPLTLLVIDIDHFKSVNDSHGHLAGDRMLRGVAQILQDAVRGADLLARYGGEEFVVLLPATPLEPDGKAVAERLRRDVDEATFPINGHDLACTISIGGAAVGDQINDLKMLVHLADQALYRAKEAGRNCVELVE